MRNARWRGALRAAGKSGRRTVPLRSGRSRAAHAIAVAAGGFGLVQRGVGALQQLGRTEIGLVHGDGEELLKFPVVYPIKVVGRRSASLRVNIDAIVREHVPDLDESQITERESNQAHFLSITYTITAQSREQIVALATALQASKDVIMLI